MSFLQQAGSNQLHQVQNGLLLCITCQSQFDKLKRYVDVVAAELAVKAITETDDKTSDKYRMGNLTDYL